MNTEGGDFACKLGVYVYFCYVQCSCSIVVLP